ncbi:dTMP kinase [Eubacteriales bacterium KG127]
MNKGIFISIEGPDGSGKTTQLRLLRKFLECNKIDDREVIFTREPGGTPIGEKIREIILDNSNMEMSDLTEAFLYSAARAQHVEEVIKPALKAGKLVVCDRFVDSSIAYQGYGRKLGENVSIINQIAVGGTMPYKTIFIDLDPAIGRNRISDNISDNFDESNLTKSIFQHGRDAGVVRNEFDRLELEKLDFHMAVYEGYLNLIKMFPERFLVVDGKGSIDEVQKRLISTILTICKTFDSMGERA